MSIAHSLEAGMLICFSLSWYSSIAKMLRTKTACGKSLQFVLMVCLGYLFGIGAKLLAWNQGSELGDVIWVYGWNLAVAAFDAALIVRYTAPVRVTAPSPARVSAAAPPPAVEIGQPGFTVVLRRRVAA